MLKATRTYTQHKFWTSKEDITNSIKRRNQIKNRNTIDYEYPKNCKR